MCGKHFCSGTILLETYKHTIETNYKTVSLIRNYIKWKEVESYKFRVRGIKF